MNQKIKRVICAATLLTTCFGTLASTSAQERMRKPAPERVQVDKVQGEKDVVFTVKTDGGGGTFTFIAADNMFGGLLVKGAPYSAQGVTENIQTLSDGNRIVRKNTTAMYRDSEGRTRHDQTLGSIGPYAAAGDPPKTFFINDPVAGVNYVLEPNSKMARKMVMPSRGEGAVFERKIAPDAEAQHARASAEAHHTTVRMRDKQPGPPPAGGQVFIATGGQGEHFEVRTQGKAANFKTESLGTQTIEGVSAEGTRSTLTIPAGEIGNELPINVVTETWFSPELKVLVLRKHNDPRNGEMIYRLININRAEPDGSLFEVPADYTIKESVSPDMKRKIEKEVVRENMKVKEKNEQ